MKKIAIVIRHSIRYDLEPPGNGMLTEDGKNAARKIGSRIKIGNTPITYYATDVQRCIDTCKNIEYGRTGNYNINVNKSPVVNGKALLDGGYFGSGDIWESGWPSVTWYALGQKRYEHMLDPLQGSKEWLKMMINCMPDGVSIWCTHDSQIVPLIYNLTNITEPVIETMKEKNGWRENPWSSPLTGIAIIDNNGEVAVRRVKGLIQGLISSDDYGHNHPNDILY